MARMTLDAATWRALMNKSYNEIYDLIEDMAKNHYQWVRERALVEKALKKVYFTNSFPLITWTLKWNSYIKRLIDWASHLLLLQPL